jgi:predicted DCC family thiol-disulfide oxidoreductase YuxK
LGSLDAKLRKLDTRRFVAEFFMDSASPARQLVLFDGECGLCDRSVQALLRIDRRGVLTFAPLQGETAAQVRSRWRLPEEMSSLIYVRDFDAPGEQPLFRSDAVLGLLARIGGAWRLTAPLRWLPRWLRDGAYDFIARRRHRWFRRLAACRIPAPEERARFLP